MTTLSDTSLERCSTCGRYGWHTTDKCPELLPNCVTHPELVFRGDDDGCPRARQIMKAMCAVCPLKRPCLEIAMVNDERFGIWGGMTTAERDARKAAWKRFKGAEGVEEARHRYGRAAMDPGVRARYEHRLAKVKACLDAGAELSVRESQILRVLVENPTRPFGVLAQKFGRKRDWMESRFNAVCERLGVE